MSKLTVTSKLVFEELQKRGCNPEILFEMDAPLVRFNSPSGKEHYLQGAVCEKTSAVATRITANKIVSTKIAGHLGIPVPETIEFTDHKAAGDFLERNNVIVVKPLNAAHGDGITLSISTMDELDKAVDRALQHSETVILQQQVRGRDLRITYIGGKFCAAVERRPASVVGDGQHSLRELIETTNRHPDRGFNYEKKLNVIPIEPAEQFLGDKIDSLVPKKGEEVTVIGAANVATGGKAIDITDTVGPDIVSAGEKLLKGLRLEVCGMDILENEKGFYFIEINNSPSLSLHVQPYEGQPRDVIGSFVDWLLKGLD